ncbi:hypothetical protein [Comamonas guangdongensis]|uniref:Uncharacterized protein n=1 Tax=Comamonas guangdongensis TaxID=510515 RepID=A0ABV3ZW47_9BURK
MGFAAPLLSLSRLGLKAFPAAMPANRAHLVRDVHEDPVTASPDNVFTMRKSRKRQRSSAKALPLNAQLTLPLQTEALDRQEPRVLKIVQREPRKQPECLLISGRMADVCAALERMARNEHTLQA